jgi:hypothetical protein
MQHPRSSRLFGMFLAIAAISCGGSKSTAPKPQATKFVIQNPTDGVAGKAVTVTVDARDDNNNVVMDESRDVTLVVSGSATGGGLVDIVNGSGSLAINDIAEETVNLSLTDTKGTGLDVSSTQNVVFAPTGATKFVIVSPANGTTGSPITVTVEAQNGAGARATQENRDVTLVADGSATGGGVVDIVDGVGTINIGDAVIETVNLSLTDHLGLGLDVSSTATATFTGPATQLVFRPIAGGAATQSLTVEVELQDATGTLTGATNAVTIAFDQNPGAMLFHASGFQVARVLEYVNYLSPQVVSPALPNSQSDEINGLVYDAANNRIIGGQVGVNNLFTYDPATGAETVLGPGGFGEGPSGMAFEMGGAQRLLGISSAAIPEVNDLFQVNPTTGAMTSLGTLTAGFAFSGLQGLATDPTTGTIYGVAMEPSPNRTVRHLVTINTSTLAMSDIGVLGQSGIAEITFVPDGTLLGVTGDGGTNPETLYSIDKTDASTTLITALGNGDDGEAITYIPAQLVGAVTVNAVNGVATFTIKIPAPANGFTLTATATGLTSATSGAFNVTP